MRKITLMAAFMAAMILASCGLSSGPNPPSGYSNDDWVTCKHGPITTSEKYSDCVNTGGEVLGHASGPGTPALATSTPYPVQATYTPYPVAPTLTPYPTQAPPRVEPTQAPAVPTATTIQARPPTAVPTTAAAPAAPTQASQPVGNSGTTPTFSYLPGGKDYGLTAKDVTLPPGQSDCFRVWQAANGVNLPWTFILCNYKVSDPAVQGQWSHPTEFLAAGNGVLEFDLFRDQGAIAQLKARGEYKGTDPYDEALQGAANGLGWFIDGFNAQVCVDGVCQALTGTGRFQMDFPRDWTGRHHIVITLNNGNIRLNQGARVSVTNNWDAH